MTHIETPLIGAYIAASETGAQAVLPQSSLSEKEDFFVWLSGVNVCPLWHDLLPLMNASVCTDAFKNAVVCSQVEALRVLHPLASASVIKSAWSTACGNSSLPVLQFLSAERTDPRDYTFAVLSTIRRKNPTAIAWGLEKLYQSPQNGWDKEFVKVALCDAVRCTDVASVKAVLPYCSPAMLENLVSLSTADPHLFGSAHTVLEKAVLEWHVGDAASVCAPSRRKI